jgi:hypothetical protein
MTEKTEKAEFTTEERSKRRRTEDEAIVFVRLRVFVSPL